MLGPAGGFNDVVVGFSPGYISSDGRMAGFNAVPGFDPTTGWGSLDFVKLLAVVEKLP